MKKAIQKIQALKSFPAIATVVFLLIVLGQYFSIEMSFSTLWVWLSIPPLHHLVGFSTVLLIDLILLLLVKSVRGALNLGIFLSSVLAIANYYVTQLHGTPFTFMQLQNIGTAMNVISSYRFGLTPPIVLILTVCIAGLIISNILFCRIRLPRTISLAASAVLLVGMYFSYASDDPLIPANVVGWSWKDSVSNYGYTPCLVKCTLESFDALLQPEDYDEAEVQSFVENYQITETRNATPDIIFILNETFYDLNQITQVNADVDYLGYIHSLEGTIQGSAIVPCAGGGTNVSEYEYLTSNSIYLAPNANPFNSIDIMNANSFATHLESLGYTTLAAHSEPGLNYARDVAYPALGFDTVHFSEDFTDLEYYAGRPYASDASLYRNLIGWYEEMDEAPRAMYLLTIQNHANYESLTQDEYLVHTSEDFGDYTDPVNEFLTCIYQSDQAFSVLVDYFEKVDRDVIICMLGDHGPAFSTEVYDSSYTEEELFLGLRSVPYVIWSNHIDLSQQELAEQISLIYMAPAVLELAGVELSVYYDYLLNLAQEVPVLTANGTYITRDGDLYRFQDETAYTPTVNRYLGLAYANMSKAPFMLDSTE